MSKFPKAVKALVTLFPDQFVILIKIQVFIDYGSKIFIWLHLLIVSLSCELLSKDKTVCVFVSEHRMSFASQPIRALPATWRQLVRFWTLRTPTLILFSIVGWMTARASGLATSSASPSKMRIMVTMHEHTHLDFSFHTSEFNTKGFPDEIMQNIQPCVPKSGNYV